MKILVIIATKNRPELLKKRSLKSVCSQTVNPNQIIIVDDSDEELSQFENISTIENYAQQDENLNIIRILNHRTKGAAGSWNSAVDYILSQEHIPEDTFIAVLDDDDEWSPNYLQQCSEQIVENSLDMVACDFFRITDVKEYNQAPNSLKLDDFLIGNPGIQGSNFFIRLSCFLEAGCFDENIKSCTDRDICIRITNLGNVRYLSIASPLMTHYAEDGRIRMSTPNTTTKNIGLHNFWLKHSRRMSSEHKNKFRERAKKLFNWELPQEEKKEELCFLEDNLCYETIYLKVGVICSEYNVIAPLLSQLNELQSDESISGIELIIFENNLPANDKNNIVKCIQMLKTSFITRQMQDKWIVSYSYFKDFYRNKNNMFSIAQARTMLQKYLGQIMKSNLNENHVACIFDEDMQIIPETIEGLKCLPQIRKNDVDIVIGRYEYASPNPPLNGMRVQLVDILYNLNWLTKLKPTDVLANASLENNSLIEKYPDYYYDLSRKHYGHLEHPFWIEEVNNVETAGEALKRLCEDTNIIFGGAPLTRPLRNIKNSAILDSAKDSVNRGGITFIFNSDALCNAPNLNLEIDGTDIRRSDMMWAVINKYYNKMNIKAVNIPIWHAGKKVEDKISLDIDKVREEIIGSCLYAGLTDFLNINPTHRLYFAKNEILQILENVKNHLSQRMILLKQSFYRARGISRSIKQLEIYSENHNLNTFINNIDNYFSKVYFELIEDNIKIISYSEISIFLNSIQEKTKKYKETKI